MYHAVELRVLAHDSLSSGEQVITSADATRLIASRRYRKSTGFPHGAIHFRRSLSDGSCLHLVIKGEDHRLHHDMFDPHAGLFRLYMHLSHEAKSEAVAYGALAWSVVRMLAR
jgi:hypothetical protein